MKGGFNGDEKAAQGILRKDTPSVLVASTWESATYQPRKLSIPQVPSLPSLQIVSR
jgi:hypothetical protein